jgi:hypothetical protein
MRLPVIIAHGQGLPGVFLIGFPAALCGLLLVGFGLYRAFRAKSSVKTPAWPTVVGLTFLAIALFSPKMDPIVFWLFDHLPSAT